MPESGAWSVTDGPQKVSVQSSLFKKKMALVIYKNEFSDEKKSLSVMIMMRLGMGQLVMMNLGMGQCKNGEALGQGRNVRLGVMLRL